MFGVQGAGSAEYWECSVGNTVLGLQGAGSVVFGVQGAGSAGYWECRVLGTGSAEYWEYNVRIAGCWVLGVQC